MYDVVILGAGSAAEWLWSKLENKSVAVIEEERLGGECPFVACIPSKALLHVAHMRRELYHSHEIGATVNPINMSKGNEAFQIALKRRDHLTHNLDDSETAQNLKSMGIDVFRGRGVIDGLGIVSVYGTDGIRTQLAWDQLIINTGSKPTIPPIKGLAETPYWTSEDALTTTKLPASVAILGGGPVGCELADLFNSFGSQVLLIERGEQLLPNESESTVSILQNALKNYGIDTRTATEISSVSFDDQEFTIILNDRERVKVERLIVAIGRTPNTRDIGLRNIGIENEDRALSVDRFCRLNGFENIYAAGDVTGIAPYTHGANYQASIVVDHINGVEHPADYSAIPRVVFTSPPVASVGITLETALKLGKQARRGSMQFSETGRGYTDGAKQGVMEIVVDSNSDLILGASIVGTSADELISQITIAMKSFMTLKMLSDVVHPFPTYSEALSAIAKDFKTTRKL